MPDLSPFLNKQPPNPKPTGQLASPRFNPQIRNFENSFKAPSAPSRFVPPKLRFPKIPMGVKLPLAGNLLLNIIIDHFFNPPPVADATIPPHLRIPESPKEIQAPTLPFQGGQSPQIPYVVRYRYARAINPSDWTYKEALALGPISKITIEIDHPSGFKNHRETFTIYCGGGRNADKAEFDPAGKNKIRDLSLEAWSPITWEVVSVTRQDGKPDTGGNAPAPNPIIYGPPGIFIGGPTYINYGSPSPPQPLPQPLPPTTSPPQPLPGNSGTPQPQPIGKPAPTPTGTPEPPPTPNPNTGPTPTPNPTNVPPATLYGPWRNPTPTPTSNPGYNPGFTPKFTPTPIQPHPGFSPNPIQVKPAPPITPLPTTGQPITTNNPTRTPTPEPPITTKPPITEKPPDKPTPEKTLEEAIKIGTGMVIIKQIVDAINTNTSPEAITTAAAAGTCRTLQPGGCMSGLAGNAQSAANNAAANNNLLTGLNTLLQGFDLTLLTTINSKLGSAIPGGISGGLGRLSKFLGIDRALNLLNFLATVHNAVMLSNGLKETLLATLSGVGNATGLLETSEGENVDLNKVVNQGVEMLMIQLFGAEVWANIETNWRKHNRIYQAAANITNAVSSMMNAIANGIETIGERTGKIGNALKAAAQVPENAYQWFSEKMNVRGSKFLTFETKVGQTTAFLNVINEVAENVIEGQRSYTEAVKATKEFNDELKKAEKNKGVENELIKKEAEENRKLATKDPTGGDEKGLLSFLTDM